MAHAAREKSSRGVARVAPPAGVVCAGQGAEDGCISAAPSALVCSANTFALIQEQNHKGIICK